MTPLLPMEVDSPYSVCRVAIILSCLGCFRVIGAGSAALQYKHHKMPELVKPFGYPIEEHFVETADGYVLGVYRIPYGRKDSLITHGAPVSRVPRPPVLLQHGLLDSSATWVVNYPDQSLGFILADAGYDVWMTNSRGNAFSRNHTGFEPSSSEFWDFSFDEMADYDFPAVVDYVIDATAKHGTCNRIKRSGELFRKNLKHRCEHTLAVVGHSQGSTQVFAALASRPSLGKHISIFVALGPAVYVRYVSSIPLLMLAHLHSDELFNMMGQHEFLPASKVTADIFEEVCRVSPLACMSVLTAICGFNQNNLNLTRLPLYVDFAPSGTSVKNMAHWAQLVRQSAELQRSLFRRYDFGKQCMTPTGSPRNCNRRVYGTEDPPSFDLAAIADSGVPIAMFSGMQDRLADPADVQDLLETLPHGTVTFTHSELSFEHIDFTWGLSSAERIYPAILRLLRQHADSSNRAANF